MKISFTVTLLSVLCALNGSTASFLGLPEYQVESYQQSPQLSSANSQVTWPMYSSVARDVMNPEYPFDTMRVPSEPEVYSWIESRVGTGKCTSGFYCRAKMLVHHELGRTSVSVGYMIYSLHGPKPVSTGTKKRLQRTTQSQAILFVSVLMKAYNPGAICGLATSDIADAILVAGKEVTSCETTGDEACTVSTVVATC